MLKVLEFYTDTCMPCKVVAKTLKKVKELDVEPVNAMEDVAKVDKYNVFSTPTLIFLKDDEEVKRTLGVVSEKELREIIEQFS